MEPVVDMRSAQANIQRDTAGLRLAVFEVMQGQLHPPGSVCGGAAHQRLVL